MKKVILFFTLGVASLLSAQVVTPKASPAAKLQQKVGLADIQIEYARPGAKGRVVFGDLIPYGQMWRLGANENTKITTSEALIFGKDTLAAGTYALFATPGSQVGNSTFIPIIPIGAYQNPGILLKCVYKSLQVFKNSKITKKT